MFNVPQGWHSDTDTDSTGSVSERHPGMFNVPQGWHSETDTDSTGPVSERHPGMFNVPQGVAQRHRH